MTAIDRRTELIEVLCERRYDTVPNLAHEFGVSQNTIRKDILVLSCSYPIYTKCGKVDGGVYVIEGYRLGRKYFTANQTEFLERISKNLKGEDLKTAQAMLQTFRQPKGKSNGN